MIITPMSQKMSNSDWAEISFNHKYHISQDLTFLCLMVWCMNAFAVALSEFKEVGG